MNLFAPIDCYCERTDPGLWSEPVNALTNAAFLLAALLLWQHASRSSSPQGQRCFAVLIAFIGLGSGLFHFFGTVWGVLLDVGSITLFILSYLHQYLRRLARWPHWGAALGVVSFLIVDRALASLGELGLNGSESYLLPGALLVVFAAWSRLHSPQATAWLVRAACLFPVSLTLRTLDASLCEVWPLGTHFGWHVLNAAVLYCCVRGLFAPRPA